MLEGFTAPSTEGMIVGTLLMCWFIYDLFSGQVYFHRAVNRQEEAGLYWFGSALWFTVALSCFLFWP